MKRNQFLAWVTLVALGLSGCAHFVRKPAAPPQYRPRAFALAVTVHRVLQPTPQQWAAIQASVADAIKAHGWVLVTDLALADHILRVEFTPSLNDPENAGVVEVIGIRPNPRLAIASTSSIGRYPTSFSYAGPFQYASWGHGGFSNSHFFGWGSAFDEGYSYGSANLSPGWAPISPPAKPSHPPHRPHPTNREDCPSPADRFVRTGPNSGGSAHTGFASIEYARRGTWGAEGGRWGSSASGSAYLSNYVRPDSSPNAPGRSWRQEPTASGAERTYSRAEPSPSLLERSSARRGSSSSGSERTYSRSDSGSSARGERSYWGSTRSESSDSSPPPASSWRSRSDSSESRPERTYSRSESSGSERSHWRSDSSGSHSDRSHSDRSSSWSSRSNDSGSDSGRSHSHSGWSGSHSGGERSGWSGSHSDRGHSRSESSHSRSESSAPSPAPAPAPAPSVSESAPAPSAPSESAPPS